MLGWHAPRDLQSGHIVYELRTPAPPLQRYIEHYWFVNPTDDAPVDLRVDVFVDARADLIFNFGAAYLRDVLGGSTSEHARSNLDAQRLVPIRIRQRGLVRISGVRFRLGGLGAFVRRPLRPCTGLTLEPQVLLDSAVMSLEGELGRTNDLDTQAGLLDAFFLDRLLPGGSYATFQRVLEALVASEGGASIQALVSDTGVPDRQVDRLFARHLGVAPKTLMRVLRFQRALAALMHDPACSLADVASRAGYFDHSHFIKDFRRMSGGVPRGYRGYFPPAGPDDFAPNVVVFLQDSPAGP